jgi:DNA-binding NtrC family response regulator
VTRGGVLVVDDHAGCREFVCDSLRISWPNAEISTAASADAALEVVAAVRPVLVLLDIRLPRGSGLDVLKRITRLDPPIAVVMMTASVSLETVAWALGLGAVDYLIKPFARQDLDAVVRRALARRGGP